MLLPVQGSVKGGSPHWAPTGTLRTRPVTLPRPSRETRGERVAPSCPRVCLMRLPCSLLRLLGSPCCLLSAASHAARRFGVLVLPPASVFSCPSLPPFLRLARSPSPLFCGPPFLFWSLRSLVALLFYFCVVCPFLPPFSLPLLPSSCPSLYGPTVQALMPLRALPGRRGPRQIIIDCTVDCNANVQVSKGAADMLSASQGVSV